MYPIDPRSTLAKRANVATRFVAFHAINEVYGSGNQCTVEGKEDLALTKFLVLSRQLVDRTGRYSMVDDEVFQHLKFNDITGVSVKGKGAKVPLFTPYNGKQVWDRGMDGRRYAPQFIADHAKVHLKFTVLKPPVVADGGAPARTDFGVVLEIPSGKDWEAVYGPLQLAVFVSHLKEKKAVIVVDVNQTDTTQASVAAETEEEKKEIGPEPVETSSGVIVIWYYRALSVTTTFANVVKEPNGVSGTCRLQLSSGIVCEGRRSFHPFTRH